MLRRGDRSGEAAGPGPGPEGAAAREAGGRQRPCPAGGGAEGRWPFVGPGRGCAGGGGRAGFPGEVSLPGLVLRTPGAGSGLSLWPGPAGVAGVAVAVAEPGRSEQPAFPVVLPGVEAPRAAASVAAIPRRSRGSGPLLGVCSFLSCFLAFSRQLGSSVLLPGLLSLHVSPPAVMPPCAKLPLLLLI